MAEGDLLGASADLVTAEAPLVDLLSNEPVERALNNESATEWPNLSPVKRDQADQNGSASGIDGHYMEDRNNSIDANNESGIDADTEGKERKEMNFLISDAKDLIQTPEADADLVENLRDRDG